MGGGQVGGGGQARGLTHIQTQQVSEQCPTLGHPTLGRREAITQQADRQADRQTDMQRHIQIHKQVSSTAKVNQASKQTD